MFKLDRGFDIPDIKITVPVAEGLKWLGGGGWCYQEKKDGVRAVLDSGSLFGRSRNYNLPGQLPASLNTCRIDGELCGGVFWAFDIPKLSGQDLSREPLAFRLAALHEIENRFPAWMRIIPNGNGGEFLEHVLN